MDADAVDDTRARNARARLVNDLESAGVLDAAWRDAFLEVPRHAFLPEVVFIHDGASADPDDLVPLRRDQEPDEWWRLAYADEAVITQVDDALGDIPGREATSSASMPSVVAQMLTALDAHPNQRVLEIGTGTGYNAALLAHRLGADAVTTVEIDPGLVDRAQTVLDRIGFGGVRVVAADGSQPVAAAGPFDRILSTAAVTDLPEAWVGQTVSGGRIITPWTSVYYPSGLLELEVHDNGSATGRISVATDFMQLRSQRITRFLPNLVAAREGVVTSTTDLHASHLSGHQRHVETAIGLRVPRCQNIYVPDSPTRGTFWLVDQWSGSWATLAVHDEPPYTVHQQGPRRLFDEVAAAYASWVEAGKPSVHDWLFTVDNAGTHARLSPPVP